MGGPAFLTGIFAAASLAVAVYCAGRLVASRRWRRPTELDTDGTHVVMGVAMAGMLVSGLRTLPSTIWEIVFTLGAAWFGYRMLATRSAAQPSPWRSAHPLPHLVECAAMVFMFGILPAAESSFSFLTLALALFLFGYVVYVGDGLTFRTPAPAANLGAGYSGTSDTAIATSPVSPATRYLAPRCAAICKAAMGITMGYMLILML
ncbi:MAG: DUF5134 domain-containing protein [Streptosporangiaceae bacterium]